MTFIKDMYRDEIRSGWLVKSGIKKSWNRMLEMWQEIDRICRKYKINYWAYGGTLLGAARHGGFIPWDTDMDLCMMRPDFNRFCDAVEHELIQEDGLFEVERMNFNNFRISLSVTTMLGEEDLHSTEPGKPYGMLVEVYPLDIIPDNTPAGNLYAMKLLELIESSDDSNYALFRERIENGHATLNNWKILENFHSLEEKDRQDFYRKYAALLFDKSSSIAWIDELMKKPKKTYTKEMFRETIYLPFESVEMPVPVGYEKILTAFYGDWHKLVYDNTFRIGSIYSPDIPYKEFLERVDLEFMFPSDDKEKTSSTSEEKISI